ncbi:MAG: hypothetical protein CMG69_01055 [Candidatus Marinimicrobia bacterium]|nr:hypothetical protein [Candidatus Neomarinimicrobiota bacterium]|tara:strand:- start:17321 stop:17719 length:399 start_codon:yes stop_codon:yes gene_type:complete
MKQTIFILLAMFFICCSSEPQNEFTFKDMSLDYSSFVGKSVTMQLIAIEPSNVFYFAFQGLESHYYCVKVSDNTMPVFAYFPKSLFKDKKGEILKFDNTKITITASLVSSKYNRYKFTDCLLDVESYQLGWD